MTIQVITEQLIITINREWILTTKYRKCIDSVNYFKATFKCISLKNLKQTMIFVITYI